MDKDISLGLEDDLKLEGQVPVVIVMQGDIYWINDSSGENLATLVL